MEICFFFAKNEEKKTFDDLHKTIVATFMNMKPFTHQYHVFVFPRFPQRRRLRLRRRRRKKENKNYENMEYVCATC
jgi:hypothetical protein